jgi:hypothetical protein
MNMTSRFKLVFRGVLFAFLSIQIDHFDALPDVIGYVLLVIGCGGLSSHFTMAQVLWAILAVLSVVPGWFIGGHSGEFNIPVINQRPSAGRISMRRTRRDVRFDVRSITSGCYENDSKNFMFSRDSMGCWGCFAVV